MIKQISVFIENEPGRLAAITKLLADNGIDIRALNIAETNDYGVLRIITEHTANTVEVLKSHGFITSVTQVVTVAVPDTPGALSKVLEVLEDNHISVEYMYSVFSQREGRAFMNIKVNDPESAEKILSENGIYIATKADLNVY